MNKLQRTLALVLTLLLASSCLGGFAYGADLSAPVPLRAIAEGAGARVFWDADISTAAVYHGATEILISLADGSVRIDGEAYPTAVHISLEQNAIHVDRAFAMHMLGLFSAKGAYSYHLEGYDYVAATGKARRQDAPGAALTEAPWRAAESAYVEKIDEAYAFALAKKLAAIGDSPLGGKTAGSDGEHKAAELLYAEMQAIGLQNVHMDAFRVDKWQFNDATLTIPGLDKAIKPYAYASGQTPPEGVEAEIIYVGKGTAEDYEDVDPSGKIVLVDLDQRGEWWVTYPTMEAANQGALAIINNCTEGYGQLNGDAYNTQDFCGPVTIPSLNVTVNDANRIKALLDEADAPVMAKLFVDNEAGQEGKSYNIWGEIPGKTKEVVLVGDHYDAHFDGFQDNACAVGLTMAIAKAMLASGYQPERTIRFILHGAEEYGRVDTRYDWSIGAWEQINRIHPEWAGQTIAYINFELPAYEFSDTMYVASTPALQSFINGFIADAADPVGIFPGGIHPETLQETSWADNFSYSIAGVPSAHNGFINDEEGEVFPFYETHYHSNFDNADTYNADVMAYNIKFYGALAMAFDQNPFLALDFGTLAESLLLSLDDEADDDLIEMALALYRDAAMYSSRLSRLNRDYHALRAKANDAEAGRAADELKKQAIERVNPHTLAFYKSWQDAMLRLTWEDEAIFPHEEAAANVELLSEAIEYLEDGDVEYVIDELLWQIDGVRAWYAYYFSRETTDYFLNYVLEPINEHNYWGTGRITGYCEGIEDLIASLLPKYGEDVEDLDEDIAMARALLQSQSKRLERLLAEETAALAKLSLRQFEDLR